MKKYLKITFIFIMIFSMFVKSGYSNDFVMFENVKVSRDVIDLVRSMFIIMGNKKGTGNVQNAEKVLDIYYKRSRNPNYYFGKGFRLCEEITKKTFEIGKINEKEKSDFLEEIQKLKKIYPQK